MDFRIDTAICNHFGIHVPDADDVKHCVVPSTPEARSVFVEAAEATIGKITSQLSEAPPEPYQPTEKYKSGEYSVLPITDPLAAELSRIYAAEPEFCDGDISLVQQASYYFAQLEDDDGRRLVALREASRFKILSQSHFLLSWMDESLRPAPSTMFKVDNSFDVLIEEDTAHIVNADAFVRITNQKQVILDSVPNTAERLAADTPFLSTDSIVAYARSHSRAAGYLASIVSSGRHLGLDVNRLRTFCDRNGVSVEERDGVLSVQESDVMAFLEIMDRRRYDVDLSDGEPERYVAASRRRA